MIKFISIFSFLVLSGATAVTEAAKLEAAAGSSATFEAVGKPALMKIQGKGASVEGAIDVDGQSAKGEFRIDLSKFTTGIETRDSHMRDKYLEVQKFPNATLKIDSVALPDDWKPGTEVKDVVFKGQLTLKDVSKPIEGKVSVGAGDMAAKANFVLKISDYPSLGVPKYMGITVADNVNVEVTIPKFVRK